MIAAELADMIQMMRESAAGIADARDLTRIRALRFTELGFDRAVWSEICALGWPSLVVPEAHGGLGLGMLASCAIAEVAGRALMPEPLVQAWLAASLIKGPLLEAHLSGNTLVLPAWAGDRDAACAADDMVASEGKLTGTKHYVTAAHGASSFAVINKSGAWLVDAKEPGVAVDILETQDGGHLGVLKLDAATAEKLDVAPPFIRDAFAAATLHTAAYLLGVIDGTFEKTIEYLQTRVQFGKTIGSFQVLQHRAVDLRLQLELTRASVEEAAARWDGAPGTAGALAAVSRAKARASNAAILVTREAIQLHGGVGFADEHDIGLFLRKAMVIAPQFGSAALHKQRFLSQSRDLTGVAA